MRAHWHRCNNFGDMITPWIIKKVSGKKAKWSGLPGNEDPIYMVTGSLLGEPHTDNCVIWGCGMFWKDTNIRKAKHFAAVRGPISNARLKKLHGIEADAIGDPVLLIDRWFKPDCQKKYKLGILTSWIDYPTVKKCITRDDICVINSNTHTIEEYLIKLLQCETTIASCLHGLVAAIAYDIPTRWVQFSGKMIGDGTKFKDFLLSIGEDYDVTVLKAVYQNKLQDLPFLHKNELDEEALLDACPFKERTS